MNIRLLPVSYRKKIYDISACLPTGVNPATTTKWQWSFIIAKSKPWQHKRLQNLSKHQLPASKSAAETISASISIPTSTQAYPAPKKHSTEPAKSSTKWKEPASSNNPPKHAKLGWMLPSSPASKACLLSLPTFVDQRMQVAERDLPLFVKAVTCYKHATSLLRSLY